MNLAKAIALTATWFQNKTDKAGEPYIMHCIHVMNNPRCNTLDRKIAAMLHDTVEEEVCTIEDLQREGFSLRILFLVTLLSHDKNKMSYDEYIKGIVIDEDATQIKLADLEHNSNITRLKGIGKKDLDRTEKYHRAYMYLSRK